MSDSWQVRESEIIEQLADRYRAQGYDVEREVQLEGLSSRADLVARRADETVLVEVKATSPGPVSASLENLAEFAERHGWRFSIALATDRTGVEEIEVLSRDGVQRLIADARTTQASNWIAALASVAAWEGAARYALVRTERQSVPRPGPLALLQALASQGLVTPPEEHLLRELISVRNAAAHGRVVGTIRDDLVASGLAIAESLLSESAPQHA